LSILADLFPAKIAGYTFIWTTYEIETWTYCTYRQKMQKNCLKIAVHIARFNWKFNNFPGNI